MSLIEKLKRPSALASALFLLLASIVPVVVNGQAAAYGLITNREIRQSSSTGSATDVTDLVRFTVTTTGAVAGAVIDFCSNSPIIGDTCTAPVGFDVNEAGLALANQTGLGANTFAIDSSTDTNTLVLSRTSASISAATTVTFELGTAAAADGTTNPTASNATFYARILTYTTLASAQAYVTGPTVGTPVDAGGVALSTADQITIQSKVQERLTFCVYTGSSSFSTCALSATNPVVLGDANGVLDPNASYVSKATKYNVTTNASNGVTIRAKGGTLTSGSFTIDPSGTTPGNGVEQGSTVGDEQFGFCTYTDPGSVSTATLAPDANYDGVNGGNNCSNTTQGLNGDGSSLFNFDLSTACGATSSAADFGENNLSCRYGDAIATKTAGNYSTGVVSFIGNISNTTEPGIYTTTMTFIATGNY